MTAVEWSPRVWRPVDPCARVVRRAVWRSLVVASLGFALVVGCAAKAAMSDNPYTLHDVPAVSAAP